MDPILVALSGMWGLAIGGIALFVIPAARRMTSTPPVEGQAGTREIPALFRLMRPFVPAVVPFFERKAFARSRERLARKIITSGYEDLLRPVDLLGFHLLLPLILGTLWVAFVLLAMKSWEGTVVARLTLPLCLFGTLWLLAFPALWLRGRILARHNSIRRSLPFVLDILTLSVEAGLDFMTALQRHVERAQVDPLTEELMRVIREIQVGKTRREALRDMSQRINFADLRSVINSLIQADELGVSIGGILRIQANQIRQRRFERAEKLANEAPVKMLFPLMFFIFPAVFLVLLGPIMTRLMEQGF